MHDFLLEFQKLINSSIEILAAVTGLLLYKKYKLTAAKFFIYFLVFVSFLDFSGNYSMLIKNNGVFGFLEGTVLAKNYWLFTLFWDIGAIIFFAFYYHKILENQIFRSIIKNTGYVFFIFSVGYILLNWEDLFTNYIPVITISGAVIIFLCTVFYFVEILLSDTILIFYKILPFYISVAIFIWWLITTPLVFFEIYSSNKDWNFIFLKWQIYLFANIFMYLTFTFALIFCKPQNEL